MGCNCNKNKKITPKINIITTNKIEKKIPFNNYTLKQNKCNSCIFNSIKNINGRCLRSNRLIMNIINDINFSCPIKRF
jgi:hypothetical protein